MTTGHREIKTQIIEMAKMGGGGQTINLHV